MGRDLPDPLPPQPFSLVTMTTIAAAVAVFDK